jgi:hypothetical protein
MVIQILHLVSHFSEGFNAIFHFTQFTLKGLYFIEITNIPLVFYTTLIHHSKHTYFTLESSVYISNYLNVIAFPPKKNLIPRFRSRIEPDV